MLISLRFSLTVTLKLRSLSVMEWTTNLRGPLLPPWGDMILDGVTAKSKTKSNPSPVQKRVVFIVVESLSPKASCFWCCCWVAKLCPTLWDSKDCSPPGSSVLHYLPEVAQVHLHWIVGAYLTISSSVASFSFCPQSPQHQSHFQWVSSSHQVAKVLELQHQSFQWIFRVNFL